MPAMALEDLLLAALPGYKTPSKRIKEQWLRLPEAPWRFWRAGGKDWAVYPATGSRLSTTAVDSLRQAPGCGLRPVLLVNSSAGMQAAARHFGETSFHIACPVAGTGSLISPPRLPPTSPDGGTACKSRLPVPLLGEIADHSGCPKYLRRAIRLLINSYLAGTITDDSEHEALSRFASVIFRSMGFGKGSIPQVLRKLEKAGYGGRRDHFFHSFQNFFFGVLAVLVLPGKFNLCQTIAKLNFAVDPFHVWFVTALWHDAGYGIAYFDNLAKDVFGGGASDTAEHGRVEFLKSSIVQEALLVISSLMVRLMAPSKARTQWLVPQTGHRRSSHHKKIALAIEDSVLQQDHGAASALRLYAEFMPMIRRTSSEKQLVLKQVLYLSCGSAPFHDWAFRDRVRQRCGACRIPTEAMPYASLLAFVDSIQDDRRDPMGVRQQMSFLRRLCVSAPAVVSAEVDTGALRPEAILPKLVEARDVLASLEQSPVTLFFQYPQWMIG